MRFSLLSTALLALAILAAPASAQTTFLLKGGLNTSFYSGDDASGTDPKLGGVGGVGVRYDVNPSLAVQVEALYSQEGAEDPINFGTDKLDYLDIPILLRASIPLSPYADAGLYAGPQIGIPLRAEFESDNGNTSDLDVGTDIGLSIGADYWSGPVGVDVRFTTGLTEAFEDTGVLQTPLDIRNQTFTVTLGYRFGGTTGRGGRY